ncbi:MAG: ABC transporter permease [Lachnospiraceae bacterium]|nr:ABC transporter permease [Lachnospiraceae bacterium]
MKKGIKNIQLNMSKGQMVLLVINVVLVAAFIALGISARKSMDRLYSQQGASRWEDKKNSYAQVSAFASPDRNLQKEDISVIRGSLAQSLSKEAVSEDRHSTGRMWIDAYSGECSAEVRKDSNTLSVTAVGVGGDFFQFHPIPLLSGGYISDEDWNQDRIVVDENFAWAMFGSNDIVGMQIWMGTTIYTIAGVVAVDEDSLYRTAYGGNNRIYVPYDLLKSQQDSLKITCYEAIVPNPISNDGYYALRAACGLEEEEQDSLQTEENPLNFDNIEVIENSNRFNWIERLNGWKNRRLRVMRTNSVGYPFWENLARMEEMNQENILVVRILLMVCPVICLVLLLYDLWNRRTWTVKKLCIRAIDEIRERQEEKALAKQKEAADSEEETEEDFLEEDDEEETEAKLESGDFVESEEDFIELDTEDIIGEEAVEGSEADTAAEETEEAVEEQAEDKIDEAQEETKLSDDEKELQSVTSENIFDI